VPCSRRNMQANKRAEEAAKRVSLWKGRPVVISPLSGGLTNENYLVESEGNRYVMRLPGQSTELLSIDRENEVYNTKAAASTRIGPTVLEHVPGVDVMVLEFIVGPTMSAKTLQSPRMTARMAQSFLRLNAAPRSLQDFNIFRLIENYLGIANEHDVTIPDGSRDWLPQVADIEGAVTVAPLALAPCHNDLLCENFIDDGVALRIVDYELSGNNDPCFDLGNTAQEAEFDQELRAALCEAYFGKGDGRQLARMNLFALMSDVGWTLWGAIQAKISAVDYDFRGYYTGRWDRALERLGRSIPHRGTFVTDVNITDLARITEVRIVLEAHAARLATEKITTADREEMVELLELVRRGHVTDQRDLMQLDQQIHRLVYRTAHNPFLEATLERYFNLSLRLWYLVLDREVRLREAVDEHVELLQAILAGDGQRAEDIMRRHVSGFEREIRKVLVEG